MRGCKDVVAGGDYLPARGLLSGNSILFITSPPHFWGCSIDLHRYGRQRPEPLAIASDPGQRNQLAWIREA